MYVQLALDPLYYQFYTPNCDIMKSAYYIEETKTTRPTIAGVLTGLDFTETNTKKYWEVYIRRHSNGTAIDFGNRVKITDGIWDENNNYLTKRDGTKYKPFAGITANAYSITVDAEAKSKGAAALYTVSTTIDVTAETQATSTETLINLITEKANYEEERKSEITTVSLPTSVLSVNYVSSEATTSPSGTTPAPTTKIDLKEVAPAATSLTLNMATTTTASEVQVIEPAVVVENLDNIFTEESLTELTLNLVGEEEDDDDTTTAPSGGGRRLAALTLRFDRLPIGILYIGRRMFRRIEYTVSLRGVHCSME